MVLQNKAKAGREGVSGRDPTGERRDCTKGPDARNKANLPAWLAFPLLRVIAVRVRREDRTL
jgi:hypothetical protein